MSLWLEHGGEGYDGERLFSTGVVQGVLEHLYSRVIGLQHDMPEVAWHFASRSTGSCLPEQQIYGIACASRVRWAGEQHA